MKACKRFILKEQIREIDEFIEILKIVSNEDETGFALTAKVRIPGKDYTELTQTLLAGPEIATAIINECRLQKRSLERELQNG